MSSFPGSKTIGRPKVDSEAVNVRMERPMLEALDAFAAEQPEPVSSRPEAVRRALIEHLTAKGYLPDGSADAMSGEPEETLPADRYADADPDEAVMVTGVGPMILRRAVRKQTDWRDHHGLGLVSIYRGADKEPGVFDMADLGRLAELERFK